MRALTLFTDRSEEANETARELRAAGYEVTEHLTATEPMVRCESSGLLYFGLWEINRVFLGPDGVNLG